MATSMSRRLGLVLAMLLGLGGFLFAPAVVPALQTPAYAADKANIDFSKVGSITLHKRLLPEGTQFGAPATGDEMIDVPGTPLAGVKYKATKLKFDLQNDDWSTFPKTASAVKESDKTAESRESNETGADGIAKIDELSVGLYLVEEIQAPEGVIKSAPFLVSIPMTNEDGKAWDYDIVAYPKNQKPEAVKSVVDADQNAGGEITYTINTPIPTPVPGHTITKYIIGDDYDENKVDPVMPLTSSVELNLAGQKVDASNYDAKIDQGKLVITFNQTGLDLLNGSNGSNYGKKVTTTFKVKVKDDATGAIVNEASVIYNNPFDANDTEDVTIPTNKVVTYLGKVNVLKQDKDEKKPLEGAKFHLYRNPNGATTCDASVVAPANRVSVGGVDEWTTNAEGKFTIDGLHVTNLENHSTTIDKSYCLHETEAPAGYAKPDPALWMFKITVDTQSGVAESATITHANVSIDNKKIPTPELPLTGGAGIGILAAVFLGLIGGGALWSRRTNAKNTVEA